MVIRRFQDKAALYRPVVPTGLEILHSLNSLTGKGEYVFPGARSARRPMSNNAVLVALRSMEISAEEMSGHGFRAVARTLLDEVLGFRADYIEHQLAHAVRDRMVAPTNRTTHLEEHRKMMQAWADYLDRLKKPAEVVPFPQGPAHRVLNPCRAVPVKPKRPA